jgi:hypothetical protein
VESKHVTQRAAQRYPHAVGASGELTENYSMRSAVVCARQRAEALLASCVEEIEQRRTRARSKFHRPGSAARADSFVCSGCR